jgi:uncharacterized protein (DUF2252 family)
MERATPAGNVLAEVVSFNRTRKPRRVRLKLTRMHQDVFAFFRGTDHLFAADWGELRPPDPGPPVLLCGDLHLENFGAYQTGEGDFLFDINDFDEAVVAPCGLDLVRCTTSILLASEMWRLTPLQSTNMALEFLDRYREVVTSPSKNIRANGSAAPHTGRGPIWELLGETALAHQVELLNGKTVVTRTGKRKIIRNELKHPELRGARAAQVREAVEAYGKTRPDPASYKVLDVTGRIAGIGSLGVRRYLVLLEGGGTADSNRLLDIKQVLPSCVSGCTDAPQPDRGGDEARRVVEAQRALQARPPAGLDVIAIGGRTFRMRQMIPDENRTRLSRFQANPAKLLQAVEVAGQLTGWSHLRGCRHAGKVSRGPALAKWASGPALDSVLASAARFAGRARLDYEQFHKALADPRNLPKALRPGKGIGRD